MLHVTMLKTAIIKRTKTYRIFFRTLDLRFFCDIIIML